MPLNSPKLANFRVNSSLVAPALWKYDEQIQVWNFSEDDIHKGDLKNDCIIVPHRMFKPQTRRVFLPKAFDPFM